MPIRRVLLSFVLLALAVASAPQAASAEPGWAPATTFQLPPNALANLFQIAYQNGGTATEGFLEVPSLKPLKTVLHIGTQSPGGGYVDQFVLGSSEGAIPASVQLAVAPSGAAVAAWTELTGEAETSPYRYRAAYRAAGSATWEAPYTIATDTENPKETHPNLTIAIGPNGTAAVGVQHIAAGEKGGGQSELVYRLDVALHPAGDSWSTQRISPADESAEGLSLGIDGAGNVTAAYMLRFSEGASAETGDDRFTIVTQREPATGGPWGPMENITHSEIQWTADALRLAVNEAGDAVVAYQYVFEGKPNNLDAWAVTRQGPHGSWTAPAQLVTKSPSSIPEAAAVAPDGMSYVLYSFEGNGSAEDCTGVVRAPAGGTFSEERCVSPSEQDSFDGSVALLGNDAYFAWRGSVPGEQSNAVVQGARWLDSAALPDVPANLDSPGLSYGFPTLLADGQGSVVAFFTNPLNQLRAAAWDGGPPILLGASVPHTASVGQAVSFAASFTDLWSGLGSAQPTWSFGDGSPGASGASASHTYAQPGVYTVTLGAKDALGSATSSTFQITVLGIANGEPGKLSDTQPPKLTLTRPSCPRTHKLSKRACKRRSSSRSAWQTLRGTVTDPAPSSGIAGVRVAVYRVAGRQVFGLSGSRFRRTTRAKARNSFVTAAVSGQRWSLKLPKLKPGSYTIVVRAADRAGHTATLSVTVALR